MNINKLNFEIKGTGFINKGSYLMMLSIIEKLEENFPDCNIGLSIMRGSYNEREQLGLGHILRYESKKFPFINNLFGFGSFIPQIVRKYFNLLLDSDIDVILDASGFQYSSQWGNKETELMAKMLIFGIDKEKK